MPCTQTADTASMRTLQSPAPVWLPYHPWGPYVCYTVPDKGGYPTNHTSQLEMPTQRNVGVRASEQPVNTVVMQLEDAKATPVCMLRAWSTQTGSEPSSASNHVATPTDASPYEVAELASSASAPQIPATWVELPPATSYVITCCKT